MTKERLVLNQENYESLEYIKEIVAFPKLKVTENASINNWKFKKEATILSTICNPNVLECFDVFLQPKALVLEYCEQIVYFGEETARIHSFKETSISRR